jgi:negative regulator of flagellin synthesis FlgM
LENTMKIGQPSDLPIVPTPPASTNTAATPPKAGQGAAATASQTAKSAGVAVTVSTRVRSLEQANRGESSAEVDMAKVEAVRSAIEQGTYVVNPEVIADKLLSNAQEMLNRTHN